MKERKEIEHESFGMISAGRVNSSGRYMFGSDIKHNAYIEITISRADLVEKSGRQNTFPRENLIRIRLSAVQWAEFLTNMNTTGVPCTLEVIQGIRQEEYVPVEDKLKVAFREGKEYLENASTKGLLGKVRDYIANLKIAKKHKEELEVMTRLLDDNLKSNAKFYLEQFNKEAERIVTESKAEAEASKAIIMNKLGEIKLNKLKQLKNNDNK